MKDRQLYSLFQNFIKDVSPLINPALGKLLFFKPKHEDYPELTYTITGMPNITKYSSNAPIDISNLFRGFNGKADIELETFDSHNTLLTHLLTHDKHKEISYPKLLDEPAANDSFLTITKVLIQNILERYYHLHPTEEYNDETLKNIYLQIENYLYNENLYFDISVPILFLKFDFEEKAINDNCSIRRISDENQKARFRIRSYSPPISDPVLSSATHEIIFKNYFLKQEHRFDQTLTKEGAYPIQNFELLFNAIKIVTNWSSGFAQILIYPLDWADFFYTDLPVIRGLSLKNIPTTLMIIIGIMKPFQ